MLQIRNGRWLQFSRFILWSVTKRKCCLLCNTFPWCVSQLLAQLLFSGPIPVLNLYWMTFCLKLSFFKKIVLCLCSSRRTYLPVQWECRSPNIRRPWHGVCTGVGTKCSWGSPHTRFYSGCICLLALFSTAWWERLSFHTHSITFVWIFYTRCSISSDFFSRALCGKCV